MVSRVVNRRRKRYRAPSLMAKRIKNNSYSAGYNMVQPTRTSAIARGVPRGPVPQKMRTVLRYCEQQFNINPGLAGAAAAFVFTGNGLFDPNITGTGHQPRGFDNYMALYTYYTVIATRMVCYFAPNQSEIFNLIVGVCPLSNNTANSDVRDYVEAQGCEINYLRPGGSSASKMIKVEVDVKTWFNSKSPVDDENITGDSTANPVKQLYWHIFAACVGANDGLTIDATCIIEYDVVFHGPNELAIS